LWHSIVGVGDDNAFDPHLDFDPAFLPKRAELLGQSLSAGFGEIIVEGGRGMGQAITLTEVWYQESRYAGPGGVMRVSRPQGTPDPDQAISGSLERGLPCEFSR
jgi:hypothetical protein